MSSTKPLPPRFKSWIVDEADDICAGVEPAQNILPHLADAGFCGWGVPTKIGGAGGDIVDGVAAVCAVATESLAAAFVLWGHRTYIEYLLQSANKELGDRYLPDLLSGKIGGATGLSNAMKFLAGLEKLQIVARTDGEALVLDGKMPWVTNLRPAGFHVAAAVDRTDGRPAIVASLAHDDPGLMRSPDLSLMAMRSTDTAAVDLSGVRIGSDRFLSDNAGEWLQRVRPAFIGLQCGMSIGLARRAIAEAKATAGAGRGVLADPIQRLDRRLGDKEAELFEGLRSRIFETNAVPLFELRIDLAGVAAEAVALELQATGGARLPHGGGERVFAQMARSGLHTRDYPKSSSTENGT